MEKKVDIEKTRKEAEKILAKMNAMVRGKDYGKMVKEGKIDQMCKEVAALGWMVLTKSLKVKEVAGKREMRVQMKLVDPDSEEAKMYDLGEPTHEEEQRRK